jgi:probable HAF family extracellular repeat protein
MWNRIRFAFTFVVPFILLLVSGSGPVAAGNAHAPTYTIIDLGTLSADSFSYGAAINTRGQVVGGSTTAAGSLPHAFLWEAGTGMQDLDTLGCLLSDASGINARGQVVGFCTRSGAYHAFLWEAGTSMQDLGTLGGESSTANSINARGQIVGSSDTPAGTYMVHAFLWEAGTGMQDLGTLGGEWERRPRHQRAGPDSGPEPHTDKLLPVWRFLWEASTGDAGPWMRRTHLRGHDSILKRVLLHAGALESWVAARTSLATMAEAQTP